MDLYPLIMTPYYRHGAATPWGGHALREIFMKDAPEDAVGESLEVSVLPEQESMVSNGVHAAKTLARMAELWGDALTGGGDFPLALKLVDAEQDTSVQVHPEEKSEAWVILNAEPGAKILCGLDANGGDLSGILSDGQLEAHLQWTPVRPGDVFYIPAGTVHALGRGIQIYELQGNSDITYRLWDWNRDSRPLHVQEALGAIDAGKSIVKNEGTTVLCRGGSRTYYVSDADFELCRLNLSGNMPLESGRMLALTPMGGCELRWGGESMFLDPFVTVVIPAGLEGVSIVGNTKVLMCCRSDRARLREELGYRAENVAGLMD